MKKVFEYSYSHMSPSEKKSFVKRVVENNLDNSWQPSPGIQTYREMVSVILRGGIKWCQVRFNEKSGVNVWSLRSPGYSLSGGNQETNDRLRRWFKWIKRA